MLEAELKVFGISLEGSFDPPRPFAKDKIDSLAVWLTDKVEGFALPPDQVHVRHTDIIFHYELIASFFGGNVTFKQDAEKVALSARGARTRQDAEVLEQITAKFLKRVAWPEGHVTAFSANALASVGTQAARETYLAALRPDPRVVGPGALGFVRMKGWPEDIRLAIEPAIASSDSLFITWHTRIPASGEPLQAVRCLVTTLGQVTEIYGVKFKTLN